MLENTFCHIPNFNLKKEMQLWEMGINNWEQLINYYSDKNIKRYVLKSLLFLQEDDPAFFAKRIPIREHWRLFKDFRHTIAYLDIETTGIYYNDEITTIAIYDGKEIKYFVNGDNLSKFPKEINKYKILVTYNGKRFDIPFIENYFKIEINHVHIDLMYILWSLGYKGGLKACERKLGISRNELSKVDGIFAVLLWEEYKQTGNKKALETLLAYNIEDVLNLEKLMVIAYNKKIQNTPFSRLHKLPEPITPKNPFDADFETIQKIKKRYYNWGWDSNYY